MNSNQKDSLDYSDPEVEKFSDGIVLEVMPQKNDSDSSTKYILIKHDYYSSDSDHGRTLLKSIFNSLIKSNFKNLTVSVCFFISFIFLELIPFFNTIIRNHH